MRKQLLSAVSCLSAVLATAGIQVDRYGQITAEEWPGKVKTDMELRADAAREASELTVSAFDPAKFDRFGGRLDAGSFEATGCFCKKKIDGRWWLITPGKRSSLTCPILWRRLVSPRRPRLLCAVTNFAVSVGSPTMV